jgi:murein DD-endopeptidase MepM/ murein hydrolase activator NlpD
VTGLNRRGLLAAGLACLAVPARGQAVRFSVSGSLEQGSLALGAAPPGSLVALDGRPLSVTADGRFAFGFGPDQTSASVISVAYPDGGGDSRGFTPTPRHYEVQRVEGLPQDTVTPPPEVTARIEREAAAIYLARLRDTAGSDFFGGFDWPARGILSGVFGSRRIDNGVAMAPHFGVDIAAPEGTPIHAPADGMVSLSDDHYLNGGLILLDHGRGVSTAYLHQSRRLVRAGDAVRRGQEIGRVGATGRATGPHLHWAMSWFETRLDPSRSTRTAAPAPL